MGELAGADVVVDPADLEGAEPQGTNAERNLAVLQEFAAREPEGKPRRVIFRFFRLAGRDPRRGPGRGDRARPQRARRERTCSADGRSTRRCRAGSSSAASATTASSCPACLRRGERHDPERGWTRRAGRLLRRLDQARPDRRDRHEQEGRDRDGSAAARGRRRRPARAQAGGERRRHRRAARRARRPGRGVRRAGRRSTRSSAPPARSPAGRASSCAPGTTCSRPQSASPASGLAPGVP